MRRFLRSLQSQSADPVSLQFDYELDWNLTFILAMLKRLDRIQIKRKEIDSLSCTGSLSAYNLKIILYLSCLP